METQLSLLLPTTTSPPQSTHTQNAWSIFGRLLSLGRPASLLELSSPSESIYTAPSYIRLLCEIPDSPLHLINNSHVTISSVGYFSIGRFILNLNSDFRFSAEIGFQFEVLANGRGLNTYKRTTTSREEDECRRMEKRRKLDFNEKSDNQILMKLPDVERSSSSQTYLVHDNISKYFNITINDPLDATFYKPFEERNFRVPFLFNSNSQTWKSVAQDKGNTDMCVNRKQICTFRVPDIERTSHLVKLTKSNSLVNLACLPEAIAHKTTVVGTEAEDSLSSKMIFRETPKITICITQPSTDACTYEAVYEEKMMEQRKENPIVDDDKCEGPADDIAVEETSSDCLPKGNIEEKITLRIRNLVPSLGKESKRPLQNQTTSACNMLLDEEKHEEKAQAISKSGPWETPTSNNHAICNTQEDDVVKLCTDQHHSKRVKKSNSIKQNTCDDNNYHKDRNEKHKESKNKSVHVSENDREYPKFESYIVEEEEGSGGYGTVYRARRKADGLAFAIKCPHVKASKNHMQNEVKMLEKFGGKSFIIKYEGSIKSGDSECLVLEHVDHDRPEVLKREIDVYQLKWYVYCMFKALAALHKQGIVHRDVKPGNFLFSREANKGYLIDFNLAQDLHKKYGVSEKTKSSNNLTFNHAPSATKSLPPARNKQPPSARASGHINPEAGELQKPILKNLKRKAGPSKDYTRATNGNMIKSQGADGSVITSTKDANSNRSAERFREPIPCQGRRELLSFVQEAWKGSNTEAVDSPTSKRKRVAATPANGERKFVFVTPMPLHSTGVPVAGAGLLKSKGDVKQKREGPCVGTKGFRAPEVLVRSTHQGQKLDVWSAGVTLLYLMIGRTPFTGDPDQNIKEIAKLRGTEDLWELAKIHNRESSFPSELFDIKVSRPMKLLDWCKLNTRRPDLLANFPPSLFDLVDKCLTVNPRLRISAEEVLEHPFIAQCQDTIRKHRQQKHGANLELGIN